MYDVSRLPGKRFTWIHTLKFHIVAVAVTTAAAATLVTAHLALVATEENMRQLMVQIGSDDAERAATLIGTKVDMLRGALKAAARQIPAKSWTEPGRMGQHLETNAALSSLFEGVLAAQPDGELLSRMSLGRLSSDLPAIGDRAYFRDALMTDQLVISEPIAAKRENTPVIVMAISARDARGKVVGVLAGVLTLSSNNLFAEAARPQYEDASRLLVMTRQGIVTAHSNASRILGMQRMSRVLLMLIMTGSPRGAQSKL